MHSKTHFKNFASTGLIHFFLMCFAIPLFSQGTVADPPQFVWTYHPATANNPEAYYSGVMEFGEATFMIGADSFTTRAYRQAGGQYSIPGPTIKMVPGNKYVLRFHNTLPYEPLNPQHNIFKDPNASNIHTHGLHISGESPGDDVLRVFEGGYGGDFVYDIAADHMGGTHWYHAHHHGSTHLQVACGAFGMVIIDDGNDGLPSNVAAMEEKQIVLGFLDPSAAGTGGDTLVSGTLAPTWTVNGDVNQTIACQTDTWQHWRVLIADSDAKDKLLEFGPECEVVLLARDGVWRTSAPSVVSDNDIRITGASRVDFAVRVSANSQLQIAGQVVATITTEGAADPAPHPYAPDGISMWSAMRPSYLRDLRNEPSSNINNESIFLGARDINNVAFDPHVPLFVHAADMVQEWTLQGAKNHPFHMHIYHVQAQEARDDFEAGEYYDTISANIDIRFDLSTSTGSPFDGTTFFHCHVLEHEDQGAMGWMDVIGGTPAPTYPLDGDLPEPYSLYYSITPPLAPDSVNVTRGRISSGSVVELAESDNVDLSIARDSSFIQPVIEVITKGIAPIPEPSSLAFSLEASVFARGTITQSIEMFNYQTGSWELVDTRNASRFSDLVTRVEPTGDISRFIDTATGCLESRLRFRASVNRASFTVNIDQTIWEFD